MYRTLLVATDGSPRANKALKAAVRMARASSARLYVVNVQPTFLSIAPTSPEAAPHLSKAQFDRDMRGVSEAILGAAQRFARQQGVRCRAIAASSDSVSRSIVRTAKKVRADLIVMASHARGPVATLLLGSTTQQVLATCRIPVLVHR